MSPLHKTKGDDPFHPDFRVKPYWWEGAPPRPGHDFFPDKVDIAIIGSGYCGLSAGIELARAGVRVAVLDAGLIGEGASTRNGGMVSGGVKLPDKTRSVLGEEKFQRITDASVASFHHLEALIKRENHDAKYQRCGRFTGAHSAGAYQRLEGEVKRIQSETGLSAHMIPICDQEKELNSRYYHGGMVVEESGGLHPAHFHASLRKTYEEAGGSLHSKARVQRIESGSGHFRLTTTAGLLQAETVFTATNGYSGSAFPWLQRRIIPIASYIIATEELPQDLVRELTPKGRMLVDTKRILYYFRSSPDGRRILFGGRAKFGNTNEIKSAATLYQYMCEIWPQLHGHRITHAWAGNVGFSFNLLPHMGCHKGIHYAGGYQGTGVAMSNYLGYQTALKLLGRREEPCVFEEVPFPSNPLYRRRPWFLPIIGNYYRTLDRLERLSGL